MPDSPRLRIAIPSKGRLNEPAIGLLKRAGLKFRRRARRLYATCKNIDATVIFANAADVPTLVAEGAVDLGISGRDLVRERKGAVDAAAGDVVELLALGFGRCRLCLAVREASDYTEVSQLAGQSIGTSFPRAAEQFLAEQGVEAHLITLNGSLEVMVALGLVEAIVELVETGDSLRENNLVPIADIATSEAVVIGRAGEPHPLRPMLIRRLEGVVHADRYVVCEYNLPADKLEDARQITPGHTAPTVSKTDDEATLAVKVMVERSGLAEVMDRLEAIGATAIFAAEITNCRL